MHIYLGELIQQLKAMPQDGVIPFGFDKPMSYRGHYDELAFAPKQNAVVSEMLAHAESAVGKTFTGYKGGEYEMGAGSECWIAEYGTNAGDKIGMTLINMWRHSLGMDAAE